MREKLPDLIVLLGKARIIFPIRDGGRAPNRQELLLINVDGKRLPPVSVPAYIQIPLVEPQANGYIPESDKNHVLFEYVEPKPNLVRLS